MAAKPEYVYCINKVFQGTNQPSFVFTNLAAALNHYFPEHNKKTIELINMSYSSIHRRIRYLKKGVYFGMDEQDPMYLTKHRLIRDPHAAKGINLQKGIRDDDRPYE